MSNSRWRNVTIVIYTSTKAPRICIPRHLSANPIRNFHSSRRLLHADHSPRIPSVAPDESVNEAPSSPNGSSAEGSSPSSGGSPDKPGKPADKSSYGSGSRRARRNLKYYENVVPFRLPRKFLEKNVILQEALQAAMLRGSPTEGMIEEPLSRSAAEKTMTDSDDFHWKVRFENFKEIESTVQAGLQLPASPYADTAISAKPHIVLLCPRKGGTKFLNTLIRHVASTTGSELVQLDAQDLAEMGGDYIDENSDPDLEFLSSLSYEVYAMDQGTQTEDPSHPNVAVDKNLDTTTETSIMPEKVIGLPINAQLLQNAAEALRSYLMPKSQNKQDRPNPKGMPVNDRDSIRDQKFASFADSILCASDVKRATWCSNDEGTKFTNQTDEASDNEDSVQKSTPTQNASSDRALSPSPLIIQINDYPEICNTQIGGQLMDALHSALQERRKNGQRILLLGTSESGTNDTASLLADHIALLEESDVGPMRTILVPPVVHQTTSHYHEQRVQSINIRHLQDMIRRLASDPQHITDLLAWNDSEVTRGLMGARRINKHIWTSDYVHRVATVALGIVQADNTAMTAAHIAQAIQTIEASDEIKNTWLTARRKAQGWANKSRTENRPKVGLKKDKAQLEAECNRHEKRLLSGVVDPSDIRTTFAEVHAPKETIQTLKDLTLLPLACPKEFDYGVLAEQSISGLLLYGPPGTGKTLLAKAVAKEGGATILEISGADLYNKWVGEGEKNVKAMFSLARKLKPCIVFIDEADALLGARGNDHSRTSHRDLINQFLREWDGMKDATALIMVATNRPFDLDDAVVRRLPRRILIDLPMEKDREEILKILLQKEVLDPEVSLSKLAADTPLYSGSDLKHLVVTAAQACVRENYEKANDAPRTPPTLAKAALPPVQSPPATLPPSPPPTPSPKPVPPPPLSQRLPPLQSVPPSASSTLDQFNYYSSLPPKLKAFLPSNPFKLAEFPHLFSSAPAPPPSPSTTNLSPTIAPPSPPSNNIPSPPPPTEPPELDTET
ncbi:MAG: hypothetical protein Q9170_006191, partial [Blastenia crenularia]